MIITNFFSGLREIFTLDHAERDAKTYGITARTLASRFAAAAKTRRAAARRAANPVVAMTLLREALELAIASECAARGEPSDDIDLHGLEPSNGIIADWLAATSRTYVDELPFVEAEALRDALDSEVSSRLSKVDTRSVLALRALRYGRTLAVAIALAAIGAMIVKAEFLVHNVALDKPIYTSGLRPESPPGGAGVVDGRTRGTFGVFTAQSQRPFVTVDLERSYAISSIRIVNRGDGWFDDGLPLVVELSMDGGSFTEVARRTTHFDKWSFALPASTTARFVRVAKATPGELALNEIEVYARN